MSGYIHFYDRDDPVTQSFLENLYWWSKSTIERYAEGRYVGDGDDLKEFQAWTKERVADLEKDIKNLKIVQNEADSLTSPAIQLVISRIEKRRDLFAELLPKFQEQIDKADSRVDTGYISLDGRLFQSLDDFVDYYPFRMHLGEDYDEYYGEYSA